jgi:hypothetical protein
VVVSLKPAYNPVYGLFNLLAQAGAWRLPSYLRAGW